MLYVTDLLYSPVLSYEQWFLLPEVNYENADF